MKTFFPRVLLPSLLLLLSWWPSCCCLGSEDHLTRSSVYDSVICELGDNLGRLVKKRIRQHLSIFATCVEDSIEKCKIITEGRAQNRLIISLGNAPLSHNHTRYVLGSKEEEFVVISMEKKDGEEGQRSTTVVMANGNRLDESEKWDVSSGAIFGAYEVMHLLGFNFFHPLEVLIPKALSEITPGLKVHESPHWPWRAFHIHTQHPLEITEVLQGFASSFLNPGLLRNASGAALNDRLRGPEETTEGARGLGGVGNPAGAAGRGWAAARRIL